MRKVVNLNCRFGLALFALVMSTASRGWAGTYEHGTVVRMHVGDCLPSRHGFLVAMGGAPSQPSPESCAEYTLVSDKVVFVIVGRPSDQFIPLADIIEFRLQKNELIIRVDDSKKEARFSIKEMVLRSNWDLMQKHLEEGLAISRVGQASSRSE